MASLPLRYYVLGHTSVKVFLQRKDYLQQVALMHLMHTSTYKSAFINSMVFAGKS